MKIIFKREQTQGIIRKVWFQLWCELELEEEERAVLRHYRLDKSILIFFHMEGLLRNSLIFGLIASIPAFFIFGYFVGRDGGMWLAFFFGIFAAWLFYDYFRETIYVNDLIHGRHFKCYTVTQLATREELLKQLIAYLKQVMETCKHWDGNQVFDVPEFDQEMTRKIIIRRFF